MALSAAAIRSTRNHGATRVYPVEALAAIYAGAVVMINSDGFAEPAAVQASNKGCVGIAVETVTGGAANGAVDVEVLECDVLLAASSVAQNLTSEALYMDDDETVEDATAATANAPCAGMLVQWVSASSVWVQMSAANSKLAAIAS